MATIKVKFKPSTVADREGTLFYQIIHEGKGRQIPSHCHLLPSEWDKKKAAVIYSRKSERNSILISLRQRIRKDLERLTRIIHKLDDDGLPYSVDDVTEEFLRYCNDYSLFSFMENIIVKLRQNGKIRTAETYTSALNSFRKFRNDEDLMLDSITSDIMVDYEAWHKSRGNSLNTISFYTRILRAVYNRAVEEEVIDNLKPFRKVYTGVEKTVKRALPLHAIRKIKTLDLMHIPEQDFARDMFLLSFMLRGMSFIDMSFLRKGDLKNGYITYRRRKTGQLLKIKWTKEMQNILDKYPENRTSYLLPIIRNPGVNERCAYRNVGYNINHNLKRIAEKVGLSIPLTLYVARHSWASAAKVKGIPLSVISEGMGHESERTTLIYLSTLDTSAVDRANSLILKSL